MIQNHSSKIAALSENLALLLCCWAPTIISVSIVLGGPTQEKQQTKNK